jgi:hypothetical protein
MSATNVAALAIAGVIALGFAVAIWRAGRHVDELITSIPARTTPPVLDVEPGIDLPLRDECELLYSLPARHPGPDRLRAAIRDQQQKGETNDA